MTWLYVIIGVVVFSVLVYFLFPIINNKYWNSLTVEQQCLGLTHKAKKLVEYKNLSSGHQGKLYYIVNKRKVLILPWVLSDNRMCIIKKQPFDFWSYPERALTDEEIKKAKEDLDDYNKKLSVKVVYVKED